MIFVSSSVKKEEEDLEDKKSIKKRIKELKVLDPKIAQNLCKYFFLSVPFLWCGSNSYMVLFNIDFYPKSTHTVPIKGFLISLFWIVCHIWSAVTICNWDVFVPFWFQMCSLLTSMIYHDLRCGFSAMWSVSSDPHPPNISIGPGTKKKEINPILVDYMLFYLVGDWNLFSRLFLPIF